jgi:phage-related holin
VFGVILDAAQVLMGLAVISMTSDVTADVARRKTMTEIMRRVLVDLLISIAATVAVVITTNSTTFLSALVIAAATTIVVAATTTTMWGIGWGQIVTMLAT